MGMFDRMMDPQGVEWQTKAFLRSLDCWSIGDEVPSGFPVEFDCQVEVVGGPRIDSALWSFATIRGGRLVEVPSRRDPALPVIPYGGLGAMRSVKDGDEHV